MVLTDHKLLTAACALMLTAGIIGLSGARTSVSMCNDKEFYSGHVRMCELWFEYGIRPRHVTHVAYHHPRPKIEFPPVQSYEMADQSVTVTRDRQASNDFRADQYIALQTADDVARSSAPYGFAGWIVSVFDMGSKYRPVPSRVVKTHVATAHPSSEGGGGGYYNAHPHIDK